MTGQQIRETYDRAAAVTSARLADELRAWMVREQLIQADVSELAGISRAAISRLCSGDLNGRQLTIVRVLAAMGLVDLRPAARVAAAGGDR